jgi:hypothetical protein
MLIYKNVKIVAVTKEDDYYDHKQEKTIKYKSPKITKKTVYDEEYCHDLGDLYEILKFNSEKHNGYRTNCEVTFELENEY